MQQAAMYYGKIIALSFLFLVTQSLTAFSATLLLEKAHYQGSWGGHGFRLSVIDGLFYNPWDGAQTVWLIGAPIYQLDVPLRNDFKINGFAPKRVYSPGEIFWEGHMLPEGQLEFKGMLIVRYPTSCCFGIPFGEWEGPVYIGREDKPLYQIGTYIARDIQSIPVPSSIIGLATALCTVSITSILFGWRSWPSR